MAPTTLQALIVTSLRLRAPPLNHASAPPPTQNPGSAPAVYHMELKSLVIVKKIMGKMQTLQNKLLKLHLKLERTSSTNALHMDLHLLKFIDIQKVKILCFVNNCLLGQCPLYFRSYFKCRTSSYKLRGTMLFIKRTRTSIGTSSIDVLAPNCGRFRKNFRNTLLNISYKRTVM